MGVPAPVHRAPPSRRSTWSKCQTPENKTGNTNKKVKPSWPDEFSSESGWWSLTVPLADHPQLSHVLGDLLYRFNLRVGDRFFIRDPGTGWGGGGERSREGSLHLLFQELALNKVGQMNVVVLRCHLPNGWRTRWARARMEEPPTFRWAEINAARGALPRADWEVSRWPASRETERAPSLTKNSDRVILQAAMDHEWS